MLLPNLFNLSTKFYFVNFFRFVFFYYNFIAFVNFLSNSTSELFSLKLLFKSNSLNILILNSSLVLNIFRNVYSNVFLSSKSLFIYSNTIDSLFNFFDYISKKSNLFDIFAFLFKNYFVSFTNINIKDLLNKKNLFDNFSYGYAFSISVNVLTRFFLNWFNIFKN